MENLETTTESEADELETSDEELDTEELKSDEDNQEDEKNSDEDENSDNEEKLSVIDKLKEKIFGKKESKDSSDDSSDSDDVEDDIDDSFTDAARKAGWTDEDIITFAGQYSNEQLIKLIPSLLSKGVKESVKEDEKDDDKEGQKEKVVKDDLKIDDEILKPYLEKITKNLEAQYQEKIKGIEERLNVVDKDRSEKEGRRYQTTADSFFDGISKEFAVFGKTEELPRYPKGTPQAGQIVPAGEAFEARNAVWGTAIAFHKTGMEWEDSLKEALDWYKGKTMEKEVRSKMLKDLKKNEKRVSPKRSEHSPTRKFTNEADAKSAMISDIARQSGIDM